MKNPPVSHMLQVLLPVFFGMFFSNHVNAAWQPLEVMGTSECSECHEEAVDIWKKTAHQKNFKALSKNKDAKAIAKKMGVRKIKHPDSLCASCHYTVGHKRNKPKIIAGVSCESCHNPAKPWLDTHNDYGGKGVSRKNESPAHRKERLAKLEKQGMIRPDNTYGWTRNCLGCHIVANEKLVNTGGHVAGSDFKLSKRTQGKIRHYDKADVDTLRYYNLVSYATELELSLRALSKAGAGEFADKMQQRADDSLASLKKVGDKTGNPFAAKIIETASRGRFRAGDGSLANLADEIATGIMRMVQQQTGYPYAASKLKPKASTAPPAPKPAAPKPPAPKPVAKPVAKPRKPAPASKPGRPPARTVSKAAPKKTEAPRKGKKKSASTATGKAPAAVRKKPSRPRAAPPRHAAEKTVADKPLLTHFDIITPGNPALCQTYSPWARGKRLLDAGKTLSGQPCFGIRVRTSRPAQMHLFAETRNRGLMQLVPGQCAYLGMTFNALSPGKTLTLPKKSFTQAAIPLDGKPAYQSLYLVITDNAYADQKMLDLGKRLPSICDPEENAIPIGTDEFESMLKLIKANANEHMAWQKRQLQ